MMSSNKQTVSDEDGDFSDWIELYNSSDVEVDLTGMYLSDNAEKLSKWMFPGTTIAAKSFLLVWTSGKDKIGASRELHTNFKISSEGEEIILTNTSGEVIDYILLPAMESDVSYIRIPDGGDTLKKTEVPTPGQPNIYERFLHEPVFSERGGFFKESFNLEITYPDSDVTVLYTLDGSEPSLENIDGTGFQYRRGYRELPIQSQRGFIENEIRTFEYKAEIPIINRTDEPVDVSNIPVTYEYEAEYLPEKTQDVFKGTTVRARVYDERLGYGPIITHTYFVHPDGREKYSLPVISISGSKKQLFDHHEGIHLAGIDFDWWRNENLLLAAHPTSDANYTRRGREAEYPVQFEYFETSKDQAVLNQSVGIRIQGGWSRAYPQKSLRLYARKEYGESNLKHSFFHGNSQDKYKRLVARRLYDFSFVDGLYQDMVSHLDIGTQSYTLSAAFLNGEFWGLMDLRERFDKHYLEEKYGVDSDYIDLLGEPGGVELGDDLEYQKLLSYVSSHSMENEEDYAFIDEHIDIENFIDYYIAEIYAANRDWPQNNISFWRVRTDAIKDGVPYHDGKWRWILLDLDIALNASQNEEGYEHRTLEWASREDDNYTLLFHRLLKNNYFSHRFVSRFADLLNTTFLPERLVPMANHRKESISVHLPEFMSRWRSKYTPNAYNRYFNRINDFIEHRTDVIREHIQEQFQLEGQVKLTLDVNNRNSENYIRVNTIDLNKSTVGVAEMPYPWEGVYFEGIPIEITAVPAVGYEFSHWEGMPEGTSAVFVANFETDKEITAFFNKTDTTYYMLEYTSGEGGYLEGETSQRVEEEKSGTPVRAVPYEGNQFIGWSDGVTDNPRIDTAISKDISVEAVFTVATSIRDKDHTSLLIYPNPATQSLTVQTVNLMNGQIKISGLDGKLLHSVKISSPTQIVDISHYPASVYILKIISTDGKVLFRKFIKQ